MSMDFEWCACPRSRLPVCSPHKSCPPWLAVFVPSTATEVPAIVANIAYPTKATDHSRRIDSRMLGRRVRVPEAESDLYWKVRLHGAFSILHEVLASA